MNDKDFDVCRLVYRSQFTVTIEKVPVPRLPALLRCVRHAVRGNWRGAKAALHVVRTGMDIPFRGVIYNAGVPDTERRRP